MAGTVSIRIRLGNASAELLRREAVGSGGFQSLLKRLQRSLSADNELVLSLSDVEKISRYVQDYGGGGFQGRLDEVLSVLKQLAKALSGLTKKSK